MVPNRHYLSMLNVHSIRISIISLISRKLISQLHIFFYFPRINVIVQVLSFIIVSYCWTIFPRILQGHIFDYTDSNTLYFKKASRQSIQRDSEQRVQLDEGGGGVFGLSSNLEIFMPLFRFIWRTFMTQVWKSNLPPFLRYSHFWCSFSSVSGILSMVE